MCGIINSSTCQLATTSVWGIISIYLLNFKNMDDLNKKAATVMKEEGMEAAVKHMFTGENGKQLSYAEMRARYG